MVAILVAVIALIVYGSLYPWVFRVPAGAGNPLQVLAGAWTVGQDRRFIADVLINIALYVPLGMSGYLAFVRRAGRARVVGPILLGGFASVCVEMVQLYTPGRDCSAIDVVNNVMGSALGVIGGMLFEAILGKRWTAGKRRQPDRSSLMLLLFWASSLVFPLFPVMRMWIFREKLAMVAQKPSVDMVVFVSAAASWYVAGLLLRRLELDRVWLWASVALIPAQFFIVTRIPGLSELTGAVTGVVLLTMFGARSVGWGFAGLLLIRGLAPFHLAAPHSFSWIPFGGFLEMDWQEGIRVLLEKAWYFGAAIWLFRADRMPRPLAVLVVAALAAGIETAQVFLPGRTAEITDPLLALMMGFAVGALQDEVRTQLPRVNTFV